VRIFLDANILFSAAQSDGAVRRLVRELLADRHVLVVNDYVLEEAARNLTAKSRDGRQELERLSLQLERTAVVAHLPPGLSVSLPDKDKPVLAAALQAQCDALVTGDRTHFGQFHGRRVGGVAIHSPASLAEALL